MGRLRKPLIGDLYLAAAKRLINCAEYKQASTIINNLLLHVFDEEALNYGLKLKTLGEVEHSKGSLIEAELYYQHALAFAEKHLGYEHEDLGGFIIALADCYLAQGKFTQAEAFYNRALKIYNLKLGSRHVNVGLILRNLADLHARRGNQLQSELLNALSGNILVDELSIEAQDIDQGQFSQFCH